MIEPSIKNLKAVVEELKNTGVSPVRERFSNIERPAETPLSDLIQEKMKLEKILQEINNLKGKICQRIGLLKMLEKGKKEIERAPNFLEETKNKLDNLREHVNPVK